jgi:LPXTG-motif cell wall-anchored protein
VDSSTMTLVVVGMFALVVIVGLLIFRRVRAKPALECGSASCRFALCHRERAEGEAR